MAGPSNAKGSTYIQVDVHYDGMFSPIPHLIYYLNQKTSITDVDFGGLNFKEFIHVLEDVTKGKCPVVYYCLGHKSMRDGLTPLKNDDDYRRFLDVAHGNEGKINVYIDHYNDSVLDWIEEEKEEKNVDSESSDEDKDSVMSDALSVDHEPDEEVIPLTKSDDPFLNYISVVPRDEFVDEDDDSDNGTKEAPIYPYHDSTQKWDTMQPILGMRFCNPQELKQLVSNYAVANGFNLWYEKNDKTRLLVRCCKTSEGKAACPFRLWATWMSSEKSFQIKSLRNEHNYARTFKFGSVVTYSWIGKHFVNDILENPKLSCREMRDKVGEIFNVKVSVGQCRNAKKFALNEIEGSLNTHYEKLWSYGAEILRANPGSTVKIGTDTMPDSTIYFSRMYVCIKGVKDGWIEGCRRVIGVDGCFLKGICRGELLSAVGRDANNHIYPIAWAVVAVENKETWKWFLNLLLKDINMGNGAGLTLLSDQHKGLIEAVKERVPDAEHRQCARHVYANFKKKFKGAAYRKLFWRAAKATTVQRFEGLMKEIRAIDVQAYDHLMERDPKSWSRAFFVLDRSCDAIENGICESFNAAIVHARKKPIITMLEEIRRFVMDRMYCKRLKGQKWNLAICPSIRKKIVDKRKHLRYWYVIPSGVQQFEVRSVHEVYAVYLNQRTCACRGWQLSGIPCIHAMAAISYLNENVEDYVATWFTTEMFGNCYKYTINPLNGSEMWPSWEGQPMLPPKRKRLPGRPKVNRKKAASEKEGRHTISKKGAITKCSICREPGHNKITCPLSKEGPSTKAKKKKGKHVPDVEDESEFEIEEMDEVENEYESEIEELAEDGDEPDQGQVEEPAAQPVVEVEQRAQPLKRKRKYSERITKVALSRVVNTKDGCGLSVNKPVTLE
ncbi:unnamed protein product [Lactuca saligna]|uniref:SWIM-type domain-containing protein n=1 Tax=Lactuca saligna TaxID=75948 RepID=A0AA36EHT7_LACSI|nr:unnamed protein product [Lactuca saligna]